MANRLLILASDDVKKTHVEKFNNVPLQIKFQFYFGMVGVENCEKSWNDASVSTQKPRMLSKYLRYISEGRPLPFGHVDISICKRIFPPHFTPTNLKEKFVIEFKIIMSQ